MEIERHNLLDPILPGWTPPNEYNPTNQVKMTQMTYMDIGWVQAIIFVFLMVYTVLKCN